MPDRWMDGKIMLLLHILTMRGSHVASLVKSTQWFRWRQHDGEMDGQMDERWTLKILARSSKSKACPNDVSMQI